ncbi:MAG: hypothetical protein HYZ53_14970 [Planctomycetes bacterium]|nr:hypothetical protein [Planctomycetota bacterium]
MSPAVPLWISSAVLCLLGLGLAFRRRPRVHVPLMLAAFAGDLTTLVLVELTRNAVERVLKGVGAFSLFHVALSVAMLVLYVAIIATGRALLLGRGNRTLHRRLALGFLAVRVTQYATSFFMPA